LKLPGGGEEGTGAGQRTISSTTRWKERGRKSNQPVPNGKRKVSMGITTNLNELSTPSQERKQKHAGNQFREKKKKRDETKERIRSEELTFAIRGGSA